MDRFSESCLDNHQCFRVLLKSMSRPGKIFQLPDADTADIEQLLCRLLATVLDRQTGCCLLDGTPKFERQLESATGTTMCAADSADFLLALRGDSHGKSLTAKRGRLDFPDEGATVLFAVDRLAEGTSGTGVRLTGPGIRDSIQPCIEGLGEREFDRIREANAGYPLGIDCIFVDRNGQLMCIPRSTRIEGA